VNKRTFLATVAVTGLLPATVAHAAATATAGPALLTLSGAIGKANRGPLDRVRDQMMVKHGIKFDKAFAFDAAVLRQLPAVTIKPTLEYDAQSLATHLDGQPLGLGGLGPQWAVYDADRIAAFKDKPLKQRFALCPWGIYHIGLKPV